MHARLISHYHASRVELTTTEQVGRIGIIIITLGYAYSIVSCFTWCLHGIVICLIICYLLAAGLFKFDKGAIKIELLLLLLYQLLLTFLSFSETKLVLFCVLREQSGSTCWGYWGLQHRKHFNRAPRPVNSCWSSRVSRQVSVIALNVFWPPHGIYCTYLINCTYVPAGHGQLIILVENGTMSNPSTAAQMSKGCCLFF